MKNIFFLLFISNTAFSFPKELEVYFLTESTSVSLLRNKNLFSKAQCQKMGDYCFDPQIGLYKEGDDVTTAVSDYKDIDKKEEYNEVDIPAPMDRNMIKCDKSSIFDMFCGKAKKEEKANVNLEIWVDTSSTMRQVDSSPDKYCQRQRLLEGLNMFCPLNQKMKVYVFNEVKKEIGVFSQACVTSGLNSQKKLMEDIESSTAKKLIIITDIYEASSKFISFIEDKGFGKAFGINKPFTSKDLIKLSKEKNCQ